MNSEAADVVEFRLQVVLFEQLDVIYVVLLAEGPDPAIPGFPCGWRFFEFRENFAVDFFGLFLLQI